MKRSVLSRNTGVPRAVARSTVKWDNKLIILYTKKVVVLVLHLRHHALHKSLLTTTQNPACQRSQERERSYQPYGFGSHLPGTSKTLTRGRMSECGGFTGRSNTTLARVGKSRQPSFLRGPGAFCGIPRHSPMQAAQDAPHRCKRAQRVARRRHDPHSKCPQPNVQNRNRHKSHGSSCPQ